MRLPVTVTLDPDDPDPRKIADCFRALARELDANPRPMRVKVAFDAENAEFLKRAKKPLPEIALDFDPKSGRPVVVAGAGRAGFDIRRRWIPDHPVPLAFPCELLVDPVDANRFRVRRARSVLAFFAV